MESDEDQSGPMVQLGESRGDEVASLKGLGRNGACTTYISSFLPLFDSTIANPPHVVLCCVVCFNDNLLGLRKRRRI